MPVYFTLGLLSSSRGERALALASLVALAACQGPEVAQDARVVDGGGAVLDADPGRTPGSLGAACANLVGGPAEGTLCALECPAGTGWTSGSFDRPICTSGRCCRACTPSTPEGECLLAGEGECRGAGGRCGAQPGPDPCGGTGGVAHPQLSCLIGASPRPCCVPASSLDAGADADAAASD